MRASIPPSIGSSRTAVLQRSTAEMANLRPIYRGKGGDILDPAKPIQQARVQKLSATRDLAQTARERAQSRLVGAQVREAIVVKTSARTIAARLIGG